MYQAPSDIIHHEKDTRNGNIRIGVEKILTTNTYMYRVFFMYIYIYITSHKGEGVRVSTIFHRDLTREKLKSDQIESTVSLYMVYKYMENIHTV